MKKIPKSITVTVRPIGRRLVADGNEFPQWSFNYSGFFRTFPRKHPYTVTYSLDKEGALIVRIPEYGPPYISRFKGKTGFIVCQLPREWRGLRVSRRVEKVKK